MKKQVIFISKNFIRMLVLLIFVSIGAFALVSMTPLDPLQTNVGQAALGSMSPEQIERLRLYAISHGRGILLAETWELPFCIISLWKR